MELSCRRGAWALLALLVLPVSARAMELPSGLLRLVPADPVAIVVTPSIEALTRDLSAVVEIFGGSVPDFDPFVLLGDSTGALRSVVDLTRPAVLAVTLVQGMPFPEVVGVVALSDPDLGVEEFELRTGRAALAMEEGWVALGEAVAYAPGHTRPALLNDLPGTDVAARLDLRAIFQQFGPMIEYFVAMALATQQPAETESGAPPPPSPLDVESLLELVALVRDGIRTLELAVEVDGTRCELRGGIDLDPDGPLALGPQPSRDEAFELAARLSTSPAGSMFGASALDLRGLQPLLAVLMEMSAEVADSTSIPTTGLDHAAVVEGLYGWMWAPHAAAGRFDADGMTLKVLVNAPEPDRVGSGFVESFNAMPGGGARLAPVAEREVRGVQVQSYAYDFDPGEPAISAEGIPTQAMIAWLQNLLGPLEIATRESMLLMTMGTGASEAMDELLRSGLRTGEFPPEFAELRTWAGPEARAWWWIDFNDLMILVTHAIATLPQEGDDEISVPQGLEDLPELPVLAASSLERSWLRSRVAMDMRALASFWEVLQDAQED